MTIAERLTAQQNSTVTVTKFIEDLNGPYDLDNIVDNGILPEDIETDISRENKIKYFTELAYLLIDESNSERATFEENGKYFIKGLRNTSLDIPNDSPNFIIGDVYDGDSEINKYLNFEFIFRLYGWFVYKDLDYDDDDKRESLHKFWLDSKKKRYPNGIPKVKVKSIDINPDKEFKKGKKHFKEYGKYENPFLKKFKKQMKSDGNTEKLSLMHFGNTGDYVPTNLQEQREKRTAQNTREQFQKDIGTRVSMLLEHFVFATSIILIPFIYYPNTEDTLKLSCKTEFPGSGADPATTKACQEARSKSRSSSNVLLNFIIYNQSAIIRVIKMFPAIFILVGFSYLMNSRLLLYFEMATEWKIMWGSISMCLFLVYLLYQILLLTPSSHNSAIKCCLFRTIWKGYERLLIIPAILLTMICTPLFLIAFYTFGSVYPFVIAMIDILGYNPITSEGKRLFTVYENNDGKIAKKLFLACACVFLIILTSEITSCFNDYYNNDLLKYSSLILNWITYIIGVVAPIILVIVGVTMKDSVDKFVPKPEKSSLCGKGSCDALSNDNDEANIAVTTRLQGSGKMMAALPGAAVQEFKDPDAVQMQKARLVADKEKANIYANALKGLF